MPLADLTLGVQRVPSESKAQNRFMHWAREHPEASGVKASVSQDFLDADHGRSLKNLPQHVEKKAMGGAVPAQAYPTKFGW